MSMVSHLSHTIHEFIIVDKIINGRTDVLFNVAVERQRLLASSDANFEIQELLA